MAVKTLSWLDIKRFTLGYKYELRLRIFVARVTTKYSIIIAFFFVKTRVNTYSYES